MGSGDNNQMQEQLLKLQEIISSMSGVTSSLLHDNQATDLSPDYEPLTRARRHGLFLAQKNLLRLAERELEYLNQQIRRYSKAYITLKNQRNGDNQDKPEPLDTVKPHSAPDAVTPSLPEATEITAEEGLSFKPQQQAA